MEQKFEELKRYMDEKFSQQDGSLKEMCKGLIENFTNEVKSEIKKQLDDQNVKITRLEADQAMLQEQIKNLLLQNQRNQEDVEELEQYGRRLCLRIDGVPSEEKETSEDVLKKVMTLCNDAEVDIPDMAFDRAHRIGRAYNDKGSNKNCKSIIVRLATFRHRTMLYRCKKKNEQERLNKSRFDEEKVLAIIKCERVRKKCRFGKVLLCRYKLQIEGKME